MWNYQHASVGTYRTFACNPYKSNQKKTGIINESRPYEILAESSELEQLVSMRDEKLAHFGILAAIEAVRAALQKDPLVDTILLLDKMPELSRNLYAAETEIPWDKIERICALHELNAIFSLSSYETDTWVYFKKSTMEETEM